MNDRGQVLFAVFMIFIVVIILALALASPLIQRANDVRNTTYDNGLNGMDCTNTSITDFTKAGCYVTDVTPAYFVAGMIALAGMLLAARGIIG